MDRGIVLAVMLLILVLAGVSNASSAVNRRDLMAEGNGVLPSPTPDPSSKVDPLGSNQKATPKTDPPSLDADKSNTSHKISPELGSSASAPPPPIGPKSKDPHGLKNDENGKEDKDPKGSNNSTESVLPSPTPDPSSKVDPLGSNQKATPKTDPPSLDADKSNTTSHKISPELGSSASAPPPPIGPKSKDPHGLKNDENGKEDKDPKGSNNSTESGSTMNRIEKGMCDASPEKCQVANLVACLQHPGDEFKKLFLLVQNGAEDVLTVNITVPSSMHIDVNPLQLAKHGAKKISIVTDTIEGTKIVLNAGKGDCILHIRPSVPDGNPFQQLPAYASRLTPVHGAYFLFLTIVIAGGTWACCKFGRRARRGDAGVPYQQLEMGAQPRSSPAAIDANTADGWDQGWGDSWDDEEAAARPSERRPAGSVSSNGLTSRPASKDGWDVDWDD